MRRDLEQRPEAVNLQDEQYIRRTADRMQDVVRGRALAFSCRPAAPCPALCLWVGPNDSVLQLACCAGCLARSQALAATSGSALLRLPPSPLPLGKSQGAKFEYLLNTGNLVSRSGLDLSQSTGFTVVAEKLNYFRFVLCLTPHLFCCAAPGSVAVCTA